MDRICMFVIPLLSILTMSSKSYSQDEFPALKGPYLGQTPPGLTAKPFAPGIVNTEEWGDAGGFSTDTGIDHLYIWIFFLQSIFEQLHPASAAG